MFSTQSSTKPTILTLTLDNYSTSSICKTTPTFCPPSKPHIQLQLYCDPMKKIPFWSAKYTVLFLYLYSDDYKEPFTIRYRVSVVKEREDDEDSLHETQIGFAKFVNGKIQYGGQVQYSREFILNRANDFLINDRLTLQVEVELEENLVPKFENHQQNLLKLSQDYQTLLDYGKFSDFTLHIGGKRLSVHKNILSARSPVFEAMFNDCGFKESQENCVQITDLEVDVCEQLLKYIYSGKVEQLDRFAPELMAAADKYQIDCLKSICAHHLAHTLEIESVVNTFLLADMHQVEGLKQKCVDFITENGKEVIGTEGWKAMTKSRSDLAVLLFECFVRR